LVAKFIADHWKGKEVDNTRLVKAALVHDLGNIVKFNFDKYPQFLGDEVKNIEFWKSKQKEIISKYGADDHEVTKKILIEIGFDNNSIAVISSKSFANAVETSKSNDWDQKILLYSDMRVLPDGISTLEARLDDIMSRMPQYYNRADIQQLLGACRSIEKNLQDNVDLPLSSITDESMMHDNNELLSLEI
jgi:hypothetical protein